MPLATWHLKAVIQGCLSMLPRGHFGNRFLQEHVTRSLRLTDRVFQSKLMQSRRHIEKYFHANPLVDTLPSLAIEIGAGRHPVVPLVLQLSGVDQIWTFDIAPLMMRREVLDTVHYFREYDRMGRLLEQIPWATQERIRELVSTTDRELKGTPSECLRQLGVEYVVGGLHSPKFQPHSAGLIVSNNTLEHVPRVELETMFARLRQLIARDGVMSHYIDLSDHYAAFDGSISRFNFLRYSDNTWRYFNNSLHYQNRLRITDYRDIHTASEFRILDEECAAGNLEQLRSVHLAEPFTRYNEQDLLILGSWLVSVPDSRDRSMSPVDS